jgi:RNA polymerase-binding protein DksA
VGILIHGGGAMAVTVDIEAVKRRLHEERAGIVEERRRGLELSLEESAEYLLAEIDAALTRIDEGVYGMCDRCGGRIGEERLEALPWATKCIECKRVEERG